MPPFYITFLVVVIATCLVALCVRKLRSRLARSRITSGPVERQLAPYPDVVDRSGHGVIAPHLQRAGRQGVRAPRQVQRAEWPNPPYGSEHVDDPRRLGPDRHRGPS